MVREFMFITEKRAYNSSGVETSDPYLVVRTGALGIASFGPSSDPEVNPWDSASAYQENTMTVREWRLSEPEVESNYILLPGAQPVDTTEFFSRLLPTYGMRTLTAVFEYSGYMNDNVNRDIFLNYFLALNGLKCRIYTPDEIARGQDILSIMPPRYLTGVPTFAIVERNQAHVVIQMKAQVEPYYYTDDIVTELPTVQLTASHTTDTVGPPAAAFDAQVCSRILVTCATLTNVQLRYYAPDLRGQTGAKISGFNRQTIPGFFLPMGFRSQVAVQPSVSVKLEEQGVWLD